MRKTKTSVTVKKKRTHRKLIEAMKLINTGNNKIMETVITLSPCLTNAELNEVYDRMNDIMHLQVSAYMTLVSEKEERWT